MNQRTSIESEGSVHLPINDLSPQLSPILRKNRTIFEPESSTGTATSSNATRQRNQAPEQKLTLFALRLAILEKTATGLGTLGFIWATLVLLGGFDVTLDNRDFWFTTVILLIEGTRIFSRSHELEWQHQATWSLADAGINSFRTVRSSSNFVIRAFKVVFPSLSMESTRKSSQGLSRRKCEITKQDGARTWTSSEVPLLPYCRWVFLSRNVSKIFYWLQLASAMACVILSLMRLVKRDYGAVEKANRHKKNGDPALTIFYLIAMTEALLFLLEKAYWEWKVIYKKLLNTINDEFEFGPTGMVSIRRFFYDAYGRCVNGSIFDCLKMDMVSFAFELLDSGSSDEQLIGVRILEKLTKNSRFSAYTLQKIGIKISVIERLVEILNWKHPQDEEIRKSAAKILAKLAGKKQNSLRVAGIPGATESISSLLYIHRNSIAAACDKNEIFNQLGLLILKKLACDQDNCGKIGNTRGLLAKIIDFIHADEGLLRGERVTESKILIVKRSLKVVKKLASTTGITGKLLRKEISEIVFTISYIRDILKHGEKHAKLQKLGIEILTSLALEEDATERIGGTGGVVKELFNIFFKEEMAKDENHVKIAAGEALGMLAFESRRNCHRILKLEVIEKLVEALECPLLCINAARILRNLCAYSGPECFQQLRFIITAGPTVLRDITKEESKLQEVMVGLAAHVFKFMTSQESNTMFAKAGIRDNELATTLVQILKKFQYPQTKTPRIRRFVIELATWMMNNKPTNIRTFKKLAMKEELQGVAETTSELESFHIFSGSIGLSRYKTSIHSLVDTAINLLEQ